MNCAYSQYLREFETKIINTSVVSQELKQADGQTSHEQKSHAIVP